MTKKLLGWLTRDRLTILSTILVTIAIVFLFSADNYANTAEEMLLVEDRLTTGINLNIGLIGGYL